MFAKQRTKARWGSTKEEAPARGGEAECTHALELRSLARTSDEVRGASQPS